MLAAITVLLFMQFAGCKYLPLLNPEKGDPDQPNTYNIPETGPVIPPLGSLEFLEKSTCTGPSGVLYLVKNNAPCTGVLVDFYPNGQKKSEITYTDGYREGGAQWWTSSAPQLQILTPINASTNSEANCQSPTSTGPKALGRMC